MQDVIPEEVGQLLDGALGEETEARLEVRHGIGESLCIGEGSSNSF